MALSDSFINDWLDDWNGSEKYVNEAIHQLSMGNDGDATYHPLYKAWRSFQSNPEELKNIQDYGKYGMGFMIFLSYGTVTILDDQQQLASIAYLFLSKALKKNPNNVNLLKNRLILMLSNAEALGYTVSSVVNKDKNIDTAWFDDWIDYKFKPRDAMLKMEFADLSKDKRLLTIDMLSNAHQSILRYLNEGNFGRDETERSIIMEGEQLHDEVLSYLDKRVIEEENIEF